MKLWGSIIYSTTESETEYCAQLFHITGPINTTVY